MADRLPMVATGVWGLCGRKGQRIADLICMANMWISLKAVTSISQALVKGPTGY